MRNFSSIARKYFADEKESASKEDKTLVNHSNLSETEVKLLNICRDLALEGSGKMTNVEFVTKNKSIILKFLKEKNVSNNDTPKVRQALTDFLKSYDLEIVANWLGSEGENTFVIVGVGHLKNGPNSTEAPQYMIVPKEIEVPARLTDAQYNAVVAWQKQQRAHDAELQKVDKELEKSVDDYNKNPKQQTVFDPHANDHFMKHYHKLLDAVEQNSIERENLEAFVDAMLVSDDLYHHKIGDFIVDFVLNPDTNNIDIFRENLKLFNQSVGFDDASPRQQELLTGLSTNLEKSLQFDSTRKEYIADFIRKHWKQCKDQLQLILMATICAAAEERTTEGKKIYSQLELLANVAKNRSDQRLAKND